MTITSLFAFLFNRFYYFFKTITIFLYKKLLDYQFVVKFVALFHCTFQATEIRIKGKNINLFLPIYETLSNDNNNSFTPFAANENPNKLSLLNNIPWA